MHPSQTGAVLAEIVEAAGRLILPLWNSDIAVRRKGDESPVTEADTRAERYILDRLGELFPDTPVVSEEHASEFGTPAAIGRTFFLVDPLDGTKAFVRADPSFTVNIGLVEDGAPVAGAVAAPATGEVWYTTSDGAMKRASAGGSGHLVRARPVGTDPLALISHTMTPEVLDALKAQYGFSRTAAMDSSVKLCRIAEGSADLYPRHGTTMEWDICAGHAVLLAAGGRLESSEGQPFVYGKAAEGFRNGWFVARGAA